MPKSLTKKYLRMVSQDDAPALLASLAHFVDPRDFHIRGTPLPLHCAQYQHARCFLALLESHPHLAELICSLSDSNSERCIDWIGACATPHQVKRLSLLAPMSCSQGSTLGSSPLLRALSHGLWDSAACWLSLDPESVLLQAPGGRSPIFLAAEPAYEIRDHTELLAAWTPAPQSLVDDLFRYGADPYIRSDKKMTALSRSISSGSRFVFDAILSHLAPSDLISTLSRGSLAFSPLHEAVWHDRASMLASLVRHGGDLTELTEKNSSLLHLAIHRDSRQCAQVLIDLGHQPDTHPSTSTSAACSSIYSSDPVYWMDWLRTHGIDLDQRDDQGAHWLELAWEQLSFDQARIFWDTQLVKPVRAPHSLLGPLERASRSNIDAVRKVTYLLDQGLFPARIDVSNHVSGTHPGAFLSSLHRQHISGVRFGADTYMKLGSMWATDIDVTPRSHSPVQHLNIDDSFDLLSTSTSKTFSTKLYPRPCLLAYAASIEQSEVSQALIQWGATCNFWSDADVLCAWREALRVDANRSTLRVFAGAMRDRSMPLWGPDENFIAIQRLGPQKARELLLQMPSVGQALSESLSLNIQHFDDVFLLNPVLFREKSFHFNAALIESSDVKRYPWRVAVGSLHPGTIKALLPLDTPMPAMAAMHVALACAYAKKPELALWASMRCSSLAAHADVTSPWGTHPERALSLWDEQMQYEMKQACITYSHIVLPATLSLPEGGCSSVLLSRLILDHSLDQARKLLELGIKAPLTFTRIADAIERCALKATAMGASHELLELLRAFCKTLCARADFRAILAEHSKVFILSRLPDPTLFTLFLEAGAPVGSGSDNAFIELCRKYAGRLSPSFSEKLADLSRENYPAASLAVASALVQMKNHNTHHLLDLHPSAAAGLRIERAIRHVSPDDWRSSFVHQCCPVNAAFRAGNIELGLGMIEKSPPGYSVLAGELWPALWIQSRAPLISKSIEALALSGNANNKVLAVAALSSMSREIERLSAFGLPLVTLSAVTMNLAVHGIEAIDHFKAETLTWLLEHGWRPDYLVSADTAGYFLLRSVTRLLGGQTESTPSHFPLIAFVLATEGHLDKTVDLCLRWSHSGLPSTITYSNGWTASCYQLLNPTCFSLYESRCIHSDTPERALWSMSSASRRL